MTMGGCLRRLGPGPGGDEEDRHEHGDDGETHPPACRHRPLRRVGTAD